MPVDEYIVVKRITGFDKGSKHPRSAFLNPERLVRLGCIKKTGGKVDESDIPDEIKATSHTEMLGHEDMSERIVHLERMAHGTANSVDELCKKVQELGCRESSEIAAFSAPLNPEDHPAFDPDEIVKEIDYLKTKVDELTDRVTGVESAVTDPKKKKTS